MNLPPFDTFPVLSTGDLVLRQVLTQDIQHLIEISFYDGQAASTLKEAVDMQRKIDLDYQNGSSVHWCIVDKATNEPMGTLGFYRGFPDGVGELGCVLRPKFRGRGIMTSALELVAKYGLLSMGLQHVEAITHLHNTAAIQLLHRAHFEKRAELDDSAIAFRYTPPLSK